MRVGAVVFLHGSGDTGDGIRQYLNFIAGGKFPRVCSEQGVALLTPTAKPRPYQLAGGQMSSVWFDRYELEPTSREHTESIVDSCESLDSTIDSLVAEGIPAERIAVGGFSMGGGISLQLAFRSRHKIGAVFALSSFMNEGAAAYDQLQSNASLPRPPMFIRHGAADDFILPRWGQATAQRLTALGVDVDFATVPHLRHELADSEIDDLCAWLFPKITGSGDADGLLRQRVELDGLQKKPALNGQCGVAEEFDASTGRFAVKLDSGERVSVKADNLRVVAVG